MSALSLDAVDGQQVSQARDQLSRATASRCGVVKGALIAIVDDDRLVRMSLSRLMNSAGFESIVFESAEEFLDSDIKGNAACLILDLRLPGMDGLGLQGQLAAKRFSVPVIFISGNSDQAERKQALEAGAVAFLDKPFGDEALLDAVNSIVH